MAGKARTDKSRTVGLAARALSMHNHPSTQPRTKTDMSRIDTRRITNPAALDAVVIPMLVLVVVEPAP